MEVSILDDSALTIPDLPRSPLGTVLGHLLQEADGWTEEDLYAFGDPDLPASFWRDRDAKARKALEDVAHQHGWSSAAEVVHEAEARTSPRWAYVNLGCLPDFDGTCIYCEPDAAGKHPVRRIVREWDGGPPGDPYTIREYSCGHVVM